MKNKYKDSLLKSASELDDAMNYKGGVIKLTKILIQNNDISVIKNLYQVLSESIKAKDKKVLEIVQNMNDALLKFYGQQKLQEIFKNNNVDSFSENGFSEFSLADLISQLNNLVGLENVKSKICDLISYQKVQKLRSDHSLVTPKNTLHLAFTGSPGTGKTTVARIVGYIYNKLGLLTKGHFIEVSRTDLVAGYQGQTALKVKNIIEKAKGGVLFIDEAYSITENEHSDSYGRECLTEITKALEDFRDDLVVIVAGYTEPMNKFFNSNPGLKSRFNTFIEFDDYTAIELMKILVDLFTKSDYLLTPEVNDNIKTSLSDIVNDETKQVANGRFVRNVYEKIIMQHSKRVAKIDSPSLKDLKEIKEEDLSKVF